MLPSDNLMVLADRLAETLCSGNALAGFRLMIQMHATATRQERALGQSKDSNTSARGGVRVGIWERQSAGLPFLRIKAGDKWRLWADVAEIPPKGRKPRVVLLGESVARGFFHDPYINPASVLHNILQASGEEMEIIDLARIDMALFPLVQLAEASVALEPDALVVFAGNNWHPFLAMGPEQLHQVAALVRGNAAWGSIKVYLESLLRQQVREALSRLERVGRECGCPIVFVVPEFNLLDWKSDVAAPALLNDADVVKWLRTRETAEQALAEGRTHEAAQLAQELISLDGGTTPVGFNIQLDSGLACATSSERRQLLENTRDSGIAITRRRTPRCYRVIQETLRNDAASYGVAIVDLPAYFQEYLGGALPGRSIFLDYCHLTVEGMQVAMAAAAERLLPLLNRQQRSWQTLKASAPGVSDIVRAEAHFLAGIHNANFGNGAELAEFHFGEAMRLHPPVSEMMRLYLDFHMRRIPSPLCNAFEQMSRTESKSVKSLLLRSSLKEKTVNFELVEALTNTLEPIQGDVRRHVHGVLVAEHGVAAEQRSLLENGCRGMTIEQSWEQDTYGYHRSPDRESKFFFACEEPVDIEVQFTSRTRIGGVGQRIQVNVNGVPIHDFKATSTWQSIQFTVPANELIHGLNELEIIWPEAGWAFPERATRIAEALESGRIPEVGAIFGEIHTLTIASPLGSQLPIEDRMTAVGMAHSNSDGS